MVSLIALALFARQDSPAALLRRMQAAVRSGDKQEVTALFADEKDADYVFRMASRDGSIQNLKVNVFVAPKGWESTGKYWATFHAWQELEQDHDPVYRVVDSQAGFHLGAEIPEWDCNGKLASADTKVLLLPKTGSVNVETKLDYHSITAGKAVVFRLSDVYQNLEVWYGDRAANPINTPSANEIGRTKDGFLRVGGLLIIEPRQYPLDLHYLAHLGAGAKYSDDRDQVQKDRAYITSFWVPSLGRLPFKSSITVTAPKDWRVWSEGSPALKTTSNKDTTTSYFKCPIPISYPKIVAGKYALAIKGEQNGHILKTFQFAPVDKKRAAADLDWMKKAIVFYEKNLGPFPFKEYDCVDGNGYYGVESYSYTILDPKITTWAVSHEMGHTYFGGVVPCPYVRDSWNEGLTQYVDDVLLHENPEVATNAMSAMAFHVPLSDMPVAWEYAGATYYRGAYVMQMLDGEIGHDKVLAALRALIKDRVGKDTTWNDLRPYFERSSGADLQWFWKQWVLNADFPRVTITSATTQEQDGKWLTTVAAHQEGTASPYKLRLKVLLNGGGSQNETDQQMDDADETFVITTDFKPEKASIDPIPLTMARVEDPVAVTVGD